MVTAYDVPSARAAEAAGFPSADHVYSMPPQELEDFKRPPPEMPGL